MTHPVTFLRVASGLTYSPSGAWVPISKARTWIASASAFFLPSSVSRANWSRSFSICSSLGQPNHDFSPAAPIAALVSGLQTSGASHAVRKMFQPPCAGGSFYARRVTTVFQSIACRSTLKPAWRSSCAATSGSFWIAARSVGLRITTGVPS
jgi:hypothetical protein